MRWAFVELSFHTYPVPPIAVKSTLWPLQIAVEAGVIVTVGRAFTVKSKFAPLTAVQPLASVTVTVYETVLFIKLDVVITLSVLLIPELANPDAGVNVNV